VENSLQSGVSKGSSDGHFDKPQSLCISIQNGCIFVVEPSNHRIQLFFIHSADEYIRNGTFLFSSYKYNEALKCFEKYAYAWVNVGKSLIHKEISRRIKEF
jgi:hypothetical protein